MDNSVILYSHAPEDEDSSSESHIDSDSELEGSESSGELLSSNIGVNYKVHRVDSTRLLDHSRATEYETVRNKYFTPEITRHSLLVETQDRPTKNHFVVHFTKTSTGNHTSGYGAFDNVIGFRLIKAAVPNRDHHITASDNVFTFTLEIAGVAQTPLQVTLTPGKYTFEGIATHVQAQIRATGGVSHNNISVSADKTTLQYTFTSSQSNEKLHLQFTTVNHLRKIVGFTENTKGFSNSIVSDVLPDSSVHYVDIVINEIPYIACKRNAHGNHVIERIALYAPSGSLNYYENKQLLHQNYFTPITISQLTIQILDDFNRPYESSHDDMFFEFELATLNPR